MQSVHVFILRLKTFTLPCLSKNDFRLGEIVQFHNKSFAKPDFPDQKGAW